MGVARWGARRGVDILVGVMRLRIDLAYDGGGFFGWAKQPTIRTVQGEIERVLHTITRVPVDDPAEPLRLTVAGRTDTGVHASHQVCHLDIGEETLSRCVGHMSVPPTIALKHRLQRMLPADITIHDVTVAPSGFDARFSALERTYVYRVADRASEVDPRLRGFVLHLDTDLDVAAMNEAAAMTIGLHDFGSFATPNPGGTTIREVKTAYWRRIPTRPLVVDGMGSDTARRPPNPTCCASPSSPTPSLATWCARWSAAAYRSAWASARPTGSERRWSCRCARAPQGRSRRKG